MIPQITIIIGTRPEAIKLAPVIKAFKLCKNLNTRVLLTGQHSEMVLDVIDLFKIKVDINLDLMKARQDLNNFTSRCLLSISEDFSKYPPNFVIVQGDTSSAMVGALAAFQNKIPIGHVEAGLRTNNLKEPFPEEANRRIISQIADLHFAPTEKAAQNLIDSKITGEIIVSGNTGIDAVMNISKTCDKPLIDNFDWDKEIILLTVHRRENWGLNLEKILKGVKLLIKKNSNIRILIPMHKNPKVRNIIIKHLKGIENVFLTESLNYSEMIACMKNSKIILTDSGGIQEEAPALGKPVLILRNFTEREEAIEANSAKLIGTNSKNVYEETSKILNDKIMYKNMSKKAFPYGDGNASDRILKKILNFFSYK